MIRDIFRFAAFALVALTSLPAQAQDLTGEVWSVCGHDGRLTWHDTRLVFTSQVQSGSGNVLEGYFDWNSSGGHSGREQFTGLLAEGGTLELQGFEIGGTNLVTSRYLARVTEDGTAIVQGIWLDGAPGIWAAARDGGAGTAERLCDLEVELS